MRKNMKTLGALACAGVLGLGAIGNPVMAADKPGEGDTNVTYVSNSTNIDADGKVVMVIPADVTLSKGSLTKDMKLSIKRIDGADLPTDFTAQTQIDSKNGGLLKSTTNANIDGEYDLLNKDGQTELGVDLTNPTQFSDFYTFTNTSASVKNLDYDFKLNVQQGESDKMEQAAAGTEFKDVLTFKVSKLTGTDLTPITP